MTGHPQAFGRLVTYTKIVFNRDADRNEWQRVQGWLRDYKVGDDRFYAVVEGNDGSLNFIEAADIQFAD